jgi:hypothetical protein
VDEVDVDEAEIDEAVEGEAGDGGEGWLGNAPYRALDALAR